MSPGPDANAPKEVFVSYVSEDDPWRAHLVQFFAYIGASAYYDRDPLNLRPGSWRFRITGAIRSAKLVIVIVTRNFTEKETNRAIEELEIAYECRRLVLPLWIERVSVPESMKHVLGSHLDGVEFEKSDPNPYVALYAMLRNAGIAVRDDVVFPYQPDTALPGMGSSSSSEPSAAPREEAKKPQETDALLPLALADWHGTNAGRWLFGLAAQDDPEVFRLMREGAFDRAAAESAHLLASKVTAVSLRVALSCHLAVALTIDDGGAAIQIGRAHV